MKSIPANISTKRKIIVVSMVLSLLFVSGVYVKFIASECVKYLIMPVIIGFYLKNLLKKILI